METPHHLRQKILHGTFALFPLIDTCWNQFGYIVSTFSPCGLDLATLFLVPFRMESYKKRCFRHLPFRENTIIMPQFLLSVLHGRKDVVSIPMHNGIAILSVVSCHFFMPFDRRNDVFFENISSQITYSHLFFVFLQSIRN